MKALRFGAMKATPEVQLGSAATGAGHKAGLGQVELLITGWLLLAVWFCSWTWGPTRDLWDSLDLALFQTTNPWLAQSTIYRRICVAMNTHLFDVVAALATLCLLVYTKPARGRYRDELTSFALLVAAIVIVKLVIVNCGLESWCGYRRESPTLAVESVRASNLEHWVEAKDSSAYCFPSDHGMVVLAAAMYALLKSPRKWLLTSVYALCFASPRVLIGAHWLTDILVGSALVAGAGVMLQRAAWLLFAPFLTPADYEQVSAGITTVESESRRAA